MENGEADAIVFCNDIAPAIRTISVGNLMPPSRDFDYLGEDRFDVMWPRHTGQWWRLYHSVSLAEALRHIAGDGHLHPL